MPTFSTTNGTTWTANVTFDQAGTAATLKTKKKKKKTFEEIVEEHQKYMAYIYGKSTRPVDQYTDPDVFI